MANRNRTAHLGLYDTLADREVGHLLAELRTGRFTGVGFDVVAVAESRDPITTMGGVRMLSRRGDHRTGPQLLFSGGDAIAFPVLAEAQAINS